MAPAGWYRKLSPDIFVKAVEAERQEEHREEDFVAAKARAEAVRPLSPWARIRRLVRLGR